MISIQKETPSFCGEISTNFQISFILRVVEGPIKIFQVFIALIVGITRNNKIITESLKCLNYNPYPF